MSVKDEASVVIIASQDAGWMLALSANQTKAVPQCRFLFFLRQINELERAKGTKRHETGTNPSEKCPVGALATLPNYFEGTVLRLF